MPIDINDFRAHRGGDVDAIREMIRRRFQSPDIVDNIIAIDEQWREATFDLDELKKKRNSRSKEIGDRRKKKEDTAALQEIVSDMKLHISTLEAKCTELDAELRAKVNLVGNYVHDSVVVSNNEDDNKIVRAWGECTSPVDNALHHHDLLYRIGGYEPEAGATVAGHRGYFLTGVGVLLNQALISYGLSFLTKKNYTAVQPPYFMNQDIMAETAQLEDFHEALYKVVAKDSEDSKDDIKYLIATSEQPISALNRHKWILPDSLPIKYVGISTCFRREAGSHGKDAWGIFRVHQFEKIEQFLITDPECSWQAMEEMISHSEEFYQSLGLSYRVVSIVSGKLNNAASKKLDLEAWFPTLSEFRELVSCSNCTDYQSRAMQTRFGHKKTGADSSAKKQYVHMLNSTLTATERTICCLLENYQTQSYGPHQNQCGVCVPKVLQPFMGGIDFMPFVRDAPKFTGANMKSQR